VIMASVAVGSACASSSVEGEHATATDRMIGNGVVATVAEWIGHRLTHQ
jgi:hypothetical protein